MSACIVLIPALTAAWPTVSASVLGAAAALGYAQSAKAPVAAPATKRVSLDVAGACDLAGTLSTDESLTFVKQGITITFSRNARGKCGVSVAGAGMETAALEAQGKEFAEQVVQQYAYNRLMQELMQRQFAVVSQEQGADKTISVTVRRFE